MTTNWQLHLPERAGVMTSFENSTTDVSIARAKHVGGIRRAAFVGVGLMLIVVGILFDEWLIRALSASDTGISSAGRLIVRAIDLVAIGIGLLIIGARSDVQRQRKLAL